MTVDGQYILIFFFNFDCFEMKLRSASSLCVVPIIWCAVHPVLQQQMIAQSEEQLDFQHLAISSTTELQFLMFCEHAIILTAARLKFLTILWNF